MRSKTDQVQVDRLAKRSKMMKTAATSIDIVEDSCQRAERITMTDDDLDATNLNPSPDTVIGDSWFSSMDCVQNMKENYIGIVKTNHSRYPKAFLQSKMQSWPAGSHLLLKTVVNKNRRGEKVIYALGYKYCKAKVMFFIFNEGAGHTECKDEYAYEAKWKDKNLNTLTRKIRRPHVCHLYFKSCNIIDVLNQSRQRELKLEKHWLTQNGYFRIVTTIFGMTVVDAWKGYIWHCGPNHRHRKVNLLDFVDMMCKDMLCNDFYNGNKKTCDTTYSIRPPPSKKRVSAEMNEVVKRPTPAAIDADADGGGLLNDESYEVVNDSQISDVTMCGTEYIPSPPIKHHLAMTKAKETYSYAVRNPRWELDLGDEPMLKKKVAVRTMRRKCVVCKTVKTPLFCNTCMKFTHELHWICSTKKNCFAEHCHEAH